MYDPKPENKMFLNQKAVDSYVGSYASRAKESGVGNVMVYEASMRSCSPPGLSQLLGRAHATV